MARPKKIGLEYFPLDCQMDDKIAMLEAEHGLVGFAVYIKLLQHIYQTENGELDMTVVFRWKTLGKQLEMSVETLKEYLETMFAVGLFERDTFNERQVLTSSGIQKRRNKVAGLREKDRSRKAEADSDEVAAFSDGKPTENPRKTGEKESKRKGKEDSSESSQSKPSTGGAGEPEKKIGAESPDLPARTPAPTPPVAAAPLAPVGQPDWKRQGYYRDFDGPWPAQLRAPFTTPAFLAAWAKWGKYLSEIGKRWGGGISEQQALDKLSQLAGGDHAKALKIITDSIANNWKNLTYDPPHERAPNRTHHAFGPAAGGGADPTQRLHLPAEVDFAEDAA